MNPADLLVDKMVVRLEHRIEHHCSPRNTCVLSRLFSTRRLSVLKKVAREIVGLVRFTFAQTSSAEGCAWVPTTNLTTATRCGFG